MEQVFVSYSSREADQANELVYKLEQAGIQCWIAPRDIPIGSDYTNEIPEAIGACPAFLLLLSPNSQNSKWVKMELTQAMNDNRYILPLRLANFQPNKGFAFLLQNAQIRPYHQNKDAVLREVISRIKEQMPKVETTTIPQREVMQSPQRQSAPAAPPTKPVQQESALYDKYGIRKQLSASTKPKQKSAASNIPPLKQVKQQSQSLPAGSSLLDKYGSGRATRPDYEQGTSTASGGSLYDKYIGSKQGERPETRNQGTNSAQGKGGSR